MAKKTIEELELDSLKQNLNSMNKSLEECEKYTPESLAESEKSMNESRRKSIRNFRIFYFGLFILAAILNYSRKHV